MGMLAVLRRLSWRRRLLVYSLSFLTVIGPVLGFVLYAWAVPMGDFAPVEPVPSFTRPVAPLEPTAQTEKHTCGFLAASALYRAYGLNPIERRLRARLGTDNRANVYDETSTGTLHPDLYRVMTQDGFALQRLDVAAPDVLPALEHHLQCGHFALALVQRRETGHLHWVALGGLHTNQLLICDSMKPAPFAEPADEWLRDCALGILLVSPAPRPLPAQSVWKLHLAGLQDTRKTLRHLHPDEGFPCVRTDAPTQVLHANHH